MGYDLHITRKDSWFDDDETKNISLDEWLAFIEADADLVLSDALRTRVPGGQTESQVAPGFCDWMAHPSHEPMWFAYSDGCIEAKNPDEYVIRKMLLIAVVLGAKVQGDDGEIYTVSSDNRLLAGNDVIDEHDPPPTSVSKRPWWKLW